MRLNGETKYDDGISRVGLFGLNYIPNPSELRFNHQVNTFTNVVIFNIFLLFSLKQLEKLRIVCVG